MAKREEWKTYANVFDQFTLRNLSWLENQGHFDELVGAIEVGKEANAFKAIDAEGKPILVKIYRLENCNFNKMFQYLKADPRYPSIKPRRREIIFAWTLREYRNILVARQAGVRVPTPIFQKYNILVEEFIGNDSPALKIKDVIFETDEEVQACYDEVVNQMRILYHKAEIVHGDLSEFNILFHDNKPVLIDFSQSTSVKDFHAEEYLDRDSRNIARFFTKRGLDITEEEVKEKVIKK